MQDVPGDAVGRGLDPAERLPFRGYGVERRLRRMQRDEVGAAVAECKRRTKARSMMREPQPGQGREAA